MKPYILILRPHNCLIAAVAVILGVMLGGGGIPWEMMVVAASVAFVICGAGNIINDYYDFEIDKVNRPDRPLPAGKMRLSTAYYYAMFLFVAGLAASTTLGPAPLALAFFNSIFLYAYGWKIKKGGGLTKNMVVSYLVASPFLFGGIVTQGNLLVILIFVLCAFLVNTSREILKDIEDYEGDKGFVVTLPMKIGREQAYFIAGFLTVTAIVISPIPGIFHLLKNRGAYFLLIIVTDIVLFYPFLRIKWVTDENVHMAQQMLKKGMVMALAAFFFGSI